MRVCVSGSSDVDVSIINMMALEKGLWCHGVEALMSGIRALISRGSELSLPPCNGRLRENGRQS